MMISNIMLKMFSNKFVVKFFYVFNDGIIKITLKFLFIRNF
jgi:hypothetical protein